MHLVKVDKLAAFVFHFSQYEKVVENACMTLPDWNFRSLTTLKI